MRSFVEYLTEVTQPVNVKSLKAELVKSLSKLADKEVEPSAVAQALRPISRKYLVKFTTIREGNLDRGETSIIGYYEPATDKENHEEDEREPIIEVYIVFSKKEKLIAYTKQSVDDLAGALAETLSHELIHASQARARGFKEFGAKQKYLKKVELKNAAAYLAADDEIEAHAWNIAGALLDHFGRSKQKAISFLQRPRRGVIPENHFDMYLEVFGTGHAVTKRLYKKIVVYLDKRLKD